MNHYVPAYYNRGRVPVHEFIYDQKLPFHEGNVVKYICRAGHKEGCTRLQDLMKAHEYIQMSINHAMAEEQRDAKTTS